MQFTNHCRGSRTCQLLYGESYTTASRESPGNTGRNVGVRMQKDSPFPELGLGPLRMVMVTLPVPPDTPASGTAVPAPSPGCGASCDAKDFAAPDLRTMVPLRTGGLTAGVGVGAGASERVMVKPMAALVVVSLSFSAPPLSSVYRHLFFL